MSISSLTRLKTLLSIPTADATQDALLTAALGASEAAVKTWCKRVFEQAVYTEYQSGTGTPGLCLRQRPVHWYGLTAATITSGSAILAGVSPSTSSLIAGMPATLTDYIPAGATVSTVDSATQVTLSAAATRSGSSLTVGFGVAAYLDAGGYAGMGTEPYPATSLLYPGKDFVLDRDQPDGTSKSGVLVRLGGGLTASHLDWPWEWRKGSLTARMAPAWPRGIGNVKVVYCAGYTSAAMPEDLKQAVDQLAVWLYKYGPSAGIMASSESYEGYSIGLGVLRSNPELGEVRRLLSVYRNVTL